MVFCVGLGDGIKIFVILCMLVLGIYDRTAFEERNYYRVWSLMLMIRSARSKGARFNPIEIVFPFVFCMTKSISHSLRIDRAFP